MEKDIPILKQYLQHFIYAEQAKSETELTDLDIVSKMNYQFSILDKHNAKQATSLSFTEDETRYELNLSATTDGYYKSISESVTNNEVSLYRDYSINLGVQASTDIKRTYEILSADDGLKRRVYSEFKAIQHEGSLEIYDSEQKNGEFRITNSDGEKFIEIIDNDKEIEMISNMVTKTQLAIDFEKEMCDSVNPNGLVVPPKKNKTLK